MEDTRCAADRAPDSTLLGALLDASSDAAAIFRRDAEALSLVAANPAWLALFAGRRHGALGALVEDLLTKDLAEHVRAVVPTHGETASFSYEPPTVFPACLERDVDVTLRSVEQDEGYVLWTTRDTTPVTRDDRRLRTANDELQRSNGELGAFASVASHDLQEPLRMVRSYVELLGRRYGDVLDERAMTYIGFAADGARRMQELIDSLLEYTRARSASIAVQPVDLSAVVTSARHDLRAQIDESGAEVHCGDLPIVSADPASVARLVQNLLSNALKFSLPRDARIDISATSDDLEWQLIVDDNGIGVPPADRTRVFELLTRLHSKVDYPGSGMGLAICRGIVERHGGRIWIEDAPLGGARFIAAFPRQHQHEDPQ